jgi:hypothetical protein
MMLKEYDVKGKHEHDDLMHEHGMKWNVMIMFKELNGFVSY